MWRPDAELLAESNVAALHGARSGIADFAELVARSIDDPEWFWDAVVRFLGLRFSKPYDQVLDTSDGIPWAKWFVGGRLQPRVDLRRPLRRRSDTARRGRGRVGGRGGRRSATLTWSELRALTDRIAAGLAARGVGVGDAVGLFLPMMPETVAALFAVAKLGAVFLPIFSGYGAEAVAVRLDDADAVALDHRRRVHAPREGRAR